MDQATIRRRLIALRERGNASQGDLARALGFNDRQTLSDIELGKRNISAAELASAAGFFGVDVDYFTDPLELAGEARFSWRSDTDNLQAFEDRAGRWVATYRHLCRLKGESVNSFLTQVALTPKSSFEEASEEGDAISRALGLGAVPALALASALESRLDTLILHVDTLAGISGAACQLGPLNAIIINRRESEGRRSFDMGHEFFHLITWQQMPPCHIEQNTVRPQKGKKNRVEQLADNFASGLLMPRHCVVEYVREHPLAPEGSTLVDWIKQAARHFHVSGQALKWRLVCLGLMKNAVAERLEDTSLRLDVVKNAPLPARFSRPFMTILGWGLAEGHLSVRRAASIMGGTPDDLIALFKEHDLKAPFDL